MLFVLLGLAGVAAAVESSAFLLFKLPQALPDDLRHAERGTRSTVEMIDVETVNNTPRTREREREVKRERERQGWQTVWLLEEASRASVRQGVASGGVWCATDERRKRVRCCIHMSSVRTCSTVGSVGSPGRAKTSSLCRRPSAFLSISQSSSSLPSCLSSAVWIL